MDPDDMIPDDIPELGDEPERDDSLEPEWDDEPREDQFNSDAEADEAAMTSAGMGEDEDYGFFGGGDE